MPLIYLSCAWLSGIFLGSNFHLPLILILTGIIPLPLFFFIRRRKKAIILSSLVIFIFFAGAAHSYSSLNTVDESHLRFYNDIGAAEIRGMIAEDPDIRDKVVHLKLSATEIKTNNKWHEVTGTALLYVSRYPAYKYGDILQLNGKPEIPPSFEDFDYKGYLEHQGIYTTILYPGIEVIERGRGIKPLEWIYSLRSHMAQTLTRVLPEPQASLAKAVVLGIRGTMPPELKDSFVRTGTTHLLAISGLHLGIIAGIMLSIGILLFGRRYYLYVWLALGIIWLYAVITGMHPPIVRGAIMVSMFLTAELLGRQRSAITALIFTAAIMVGISPYILGDAAFQLSFMAMAGLIFVYPALRNPGIKAIKATLGEEGTMASLAHIVNDSICVTLGAIIAVWPLVAYYFGIISFIGPLATFLLLPAVPGVIIAGTLTAILGFVSLPTAQVTGWLTWLFLLYIVGIVRWLAEPVFSSVEVGQISLALVWAYYLLMGAAICLKSRWGRLIVLPPGAASRIKSSAGASTGFLNRLPKKWIIPPLLLIAILVSFTAATLPDDNLHVSFLDVGQGDAIFVQKGNLQVLIDGGPSPQAISVALGKEMPFWDRTIDLLILTHPHHDHLTGLIETLRRFQVRQVLYVNPEYDSPVYDEWLKIIEKEDILQTIAQAGQQIDLGKAAVISVLNPQREPLQGTQSDIDNNSVVLRLSQGEVSFLFTGDMMLEAEWELAGNRANLRSTVLKVAHHGSDTSSTAEFLAVVDPQAAVIQVGTDNKFGHPDEAVLARLEEIINSENIYRTDEHGTIEFTTNGEKLWVEVEHRRN